MEESGVKVVDVDGVADDVVAELVGFAVDETFLETTAGHPHGEAARVVVASEVVFGDIALTVGGAAEFAAPDDEGFVEETALFEVGDEGGGALIGFCAFLADAAGETAVVVPVAVAELDEADAAFGETAGEETVVSEAGFALFRAVGVEDGLRFLGEIGEFGDTGLHAEGEFVVFDLGGDGWVAELAEGEPVEFVGGVEEIASGLTGDALGVGDVEDWVAGVAELDPAVLGGEEAAAPVTGLERLAAAAAGEDDEGGEVLVAGAETVGEPCAHDGAAGLLVAGGEERDGWVVVDRVGVDGADERAVVDDLGEVREEIGEVHLGRAELLEFEGRADAEEVFLAAGHGGDPLAFADTFGEVLAGHFDELRFGVEEIEMGRGP